MVGGSRRELVALTLLDSPNVNVAWARRYVEDYRRYSPARNL